MRSTRFQIWRKRCVAGGEVRRAGGIVMFCLALLWSLSAVSTPRVMTLSGRILKPGGEPLESSLVQFDVYVLSPIGCLLYHEQFLGVNMENSRGLYNLRLGENPARRVDTFQDSLTLAQVSLDEVFNNNRLAALEADCTGVNSDTTYSPGATDNRIVRMSFNDGSGAGTIIADQPMVVGSVPYAMSASRLGGLQAADVLTLGSGLGSGTGPGAHLDQASLEGVFSETNYPRLMSILGSPTSFIYGADPGVADRVAGQIWYNSGAGRFEYFDGTSVVNLDGSGGGGAPTGAAGGDLTGTYPNPTIANNAVTTSKIADGAVSGAKVTAGSLTLDRLDPTVYGTSGPNRLLQLDGSGWLPPLNASQLTDVPAALGTLLQNGGRPLTSNWDVGGYLLQNFRGELQSGTAASPAVAFSGTSSNTGVFSPAEDVIAFSTNGSERMRMAANGNLGLFTNNPQAKLHIASGEAETQTQTIYSTANPYLQTGNFSANRFDAYWNASTVNTGNLKVAEIFGWVDGNRTNNQIVGSHVFLQLLASSNTNTTKGLHSQIRLDSTGVNGDVMGLHAEVNYGSGATATNAYGLYVGDIESATNEFGVYSAGADDRNYFAGSLGLGEANPAEKLHVVGNVQADGFITSSDARLKRNIASLSGLEIISRLRGVSYQRLDSERTEFGLIAQEVEEQFPGLVTTNPQTGFKAVRYQELISPLIEGVKEVHEQCLWREAEVSKDLIRQRQINLEMRQQINTLERRLASQEEKFERLSRQFFEMNKEVRSRSSKK